MEAKAPSRLPIPGLPSDLTWSVCGILAGKNLWPYLYIMKSGWALHSDRGLSHLASCVILGKLHHLSQPGFLHL